ncbi:MAG: hypothetical protein ACRCZF_20110 [Gemmataceae bacterium]
MNRRMILASVAIAVVSSLSGCCGLLRNCLHPFRCQSCAVGFEGPAAPSFPVGYSGPVGYNGPLGGSPQPGCSTCYSGGAATAAAPLTAPAPMAYPVSYGHAAAGYGGNPVFSGSTPLGNPNVYLGPAGTGAGTGTGTGTSTGAGTTNPMTNPMGEKK